MAAGSFKLRLAGMTRPNEGKLHPKNGLFEKASFTTVPTDIES